MINDNMYQKASLADAEIKITLQIFEERLDMKGNYL